MDQEQDVRNALSEVGMAKVVLHCDVLFRELMKLVPNGIQVQVQLRAEGSDSRAQAVTQGLLDRLNRVIEEVAHDDAHERLSPTLPHSNSPRIRLNGANGAVWIEDDMSQLKMSRRCSIAVVWQREGDLKAITASFIGAGGEHYLPVIQRV